MIKISDILAVVNQVQNDPTPSLGGNLDTANHSITNSAGDVVIVGSGSNSVIIENLKFPTVSGTNGQVLTTNGSGQLYFSTVSGGSSLVLIVENPISPTLPQATGNNAIAIGNGAKAQATNSLAIGSGSLTRLKGQTAFASGSFATAGDCQYGKYLLRNDTSDNVITSLFLDGSLETTSLMIQNNSTWTFKAIATAHRTDASNGHAGWEFNGVVYRTTSASHIFFQGSPNKTIVSKSDTSWDMNVYVDTSLGALVFKVVGENGKTIRWSVFVETVEITN